MADAVNHTLQEHQIDTRIDHRSFADQGRDEQPTIHEGYHARDMEKKGLIPTAVRSTGRYDQTIDSSGN